MCLSQCGIITKNWTLTELVLSSFALIFINLLALSGNLLVIFVILLTKELRRKESNWFVLNLALADLLVSLTVIPASLDTVINGHFRFGTSFKEFIGFANFLFCICSIMNLLLLSVDRWFAIAKPFRYLQVITPKKASTACLFVWFYSMLCALPPKFGISSYYCFIPNIDNCDLEKDWSGSKNALIFAIAVLGLSYCFAVAVMVVLYWRIFRITRSHIRRINVQHSLRSRLETSEYSEQKERPVDDFSTVISNVLEIEDTATKRSPSRKMRSSRKNRKWTNENRQFPRASDIQTAKSFLIVIGVYFLCWTPFCFMLMLDIIMSKKMNQTGALIGLWIGYANSCLNPVIYTWKYKQFRHALVSNGKKLREKFFVK